MKSSKGPGEDDIVIEPISETISKSLLTDFSSTTTESKRALG